MPQIIAITQARLNSRRLPQKVIKKILNKEMIIHQLQRVQKSKLITKSILAISTKDKILSKLANKYGFTSYMGDLDNVLKRFYDLCQSLKLKDDDIIVRLTGDCPLMDHTIIDESIQEFVNSKSDYISNCEHIIYPDGFDVEVFNYKSLKISHKQAYKKEHLEHVTPFMKSSKLIKKSQIIKKEIHTNWRLCVDEETDFTLIEKIFIHFNKTHFSFQDIVDFLDKNKELLKINSHIKRNEGYII